MGISCARARRTPPRGAAAARREIKRQKDASEDAAVVVEMLGEYEDGNGKKRETPLRAMLRAVFDERRARPGFLKNPNDDVNEPPKPKSARSRFD